MARTIGRNEQRQQTRARLIDSALHVFAEQGYDHATVEDISEAAGYSKGAYYFHFQSKEDIFLELVAIWVEEQTHRLSFSENTNGLAALAAIETLESFIRYDDRQPQWRLLLPEIWAQSQRNPKIRETLQNAYADWIDIIKSILTKADGEGLISLAVEADVAASLVLAAHDGLTLRSRLKGPDEREFAARDVVNGLVALIAPSRVTAATIVPVKSRTVNRKQ
jgi:AcrR family transcriptional regulator